jgi:iron complex outermembrane receptor protein
MLHIISPTVCGTESECDGNEPVYLTHSINNHYNKYDNSFIKRTSASFQQKKPPANDTSNDKTYSDSIILSEVIVRGKQPTGLLGEKISRVQTISLYDIENLPLTDIYTILEHMNSVEIRKRGAQGIQGDLSIRGGMFDQSSVLLNGMKMNNPQTGHHSLNLPVSSHDIQRVEMIQSPMTYILYPTIFSGGINIVTHDPENQDQFRFHTEIGQHALLNTAISGAYSFNHHSHYLSTSYNTCQGYRDNTDFNMFNIFYYGQVNTALGQFSLQTGHNTKQFGANGFYTAKFPEQFEHTRSTFSHLKYSTGKTLNITSHLYWNRHQDRFELFRNEAPDWYQGHNYHLTNVYGSDLFITYQSSIGRSLLGVELKKENIYSNVLGEEISCKINIPFESNGIFNHYSSRTIFNISLSQQFKLGKFHIGGGLLSNVVNGYSMDFYDFYNAVYHISNNFQAYGAYRNAFRLPTFTDLYYNGPTNAGNVELNKEEARHAELGINYETAPWKFTITGFRRQGRNLIDWVKNPEDPYYHIVNGDSTWLWRTMNHTNIITQGFEINNTLNLHNLLNKNFPVEFIRAGYSFWVRDKHSGNIISKYVLDHLKHQLVITLKHSIIKNIHAVWQYGYYDRAGSYSYYNSATGTSVEKPYNPYSLLDARVFWKKQNYSVYIDGSNLFNTKYREIGSVPMPGRWIKGGIKITLL